MSNLSILIKTIKHELIFIKSYANQLQNKLSALTMERKMALLIVSLVIINTFFPAITKAEVISPQTHQAQFTLEKANLAPEDYYAQRIEELKKQEAELTQTKFNAGVLEKKMVTLTADDLAKINKTPDSPYRVVKTMNVSSTAYNSEVGQTDNSPCITADSYNVCAYNEENVVAANFLPFGTKIRIPDYFGDRVFTVHDRMNARYYYKVDIWMKTRQSALNWGRRTVKIEILEEVN